MSAHAVHLISLCVLAMLASPALRAQSPIDGQRVEMIQPVDPDPSALVYGSISVPVDQPAMNAARPDTIITRDPEPHELVAGPRRQEILPGPTSPDPIKIADP